MKRLNLALIIFLIILLPFMSIQKYKRPKHWADPDKYLPPEIDREIWDQKIDMEEPKCPVRL